MIDHPWEQGCGLTRTNRSENNRLQTAPAGHYQPFKPPPHYQIASACKFSPILYLHIIMIIINTTFMERSIRKFLSTVPRLTKQMGLSIDLKLSNEGAA